MTTFDYVHLIQTSLSDTTLQYSTFFISFAEILCYASSLKKLQGFLSFAAISDFRANNEYMPSVRAPRRGIIASTHSFISMSR